MRNWQYCPTVIMVSASMLGRTGFRVGYIPLKPLPIRLQFHG